MKPKRDNSIVNFMMLLAFLITMICFIVIVIAVVSQVDWECCSFSKVYMGNIGTFLSGTIGVLLSFVSFLLMWRTFSTQKKQFDMQDSLQRQASFETTYFNLLNSLDGIRNNAVLVLKKKNPSINSLTEWHKIMKDFFEESGEDVIVKSDDVASLIEATEGKVAEIYEKFIDENSYIGFYFRYIYNLLKFVVDYWSDASYKKKYVDLLCARLTDEELSLVFYNALSKYGLNQEECPKFKEILDRYQVFENLNKDYLVDRSHFRFYPHTDFKFLTRDERKDYLTV